MGGYSVPPLVIFSDVALLEEEMKVVVVLGGQLRKVVKVRS
jgi:hypothetical protein